MPRRREIVYPVFLECCQYTEDSFWESIFEDLAYGIPPYGTYISKGFLTCNYRGKEFSYKIERKDPKILYNDINRLLTEKLGILSQKEKVRKRVAFDKMKKSIETLRQDWSKIRKKNVKDTMYERYVIDMKRKYSLTVRQSRYLLSIIMISIMFKTITSRDIEYEGDKIKNIKGIDFAPGKIILRRPICSSPSMISSRESPEQEDKKLMIENWSKYLSQVKTIE